MWKACKMICTLKTGLRITYNKPDTKQRHNEMTSLCQRRAQEHIVNNSSYFLNHYIWESRQRTQEAGDTKVIYMVAALKEFIGFGISLLSNNFHWV